MKRMVSIWFPHLVTDWFENRKPELKGQALVVRQLIRNRMCIVAVNPVAGSMGIQPGMVLADAKAIFPSLVALDTVPGLQQRLLNKFAEWFIRYTPVAAIDFPDGILLDASGCTHLWGGEQQYLHDIKNKISARGYQVRLSIADTIGAAWAFARFSGSTHFSEKKHLNKELAALPVSALRLDPALISRLALLGLNKIESLISISPNILRRRFGNELNRRIDQALGKEEEWLRAVHPPEPFQSRFPCLEPILRREGIDIALERLLTDLCEQLSRQSTGARSIMLQVYRIDHQEQQLSITTSAPSNNAVHLFKLFEWHLGKIAPGPGIELFMLTANKTEPCIAHQQHIWEAAPGAGGQELSELIDRIGNRIGSGRIHRYIPAAHYLPEKSFRTATTSDEQTDIPWYTERPRPILLLPDPEKIEVTAPIPDYPPMMFRHKGKLHKIIKGEGPERIEQEWWIKEGKHRDYFTVEDESGCRYWVFRSGHYDAEQTYNWFLHGYFA